MSRGFDEGLFETAVFLILFPAVLPPFVPVAKSVEDSGLGSRRAVLGEGLDRVDFDRYRGVLEAL